MIQWTNGNGGVFGGGSSYSAIYHTDFDVFKPEYFPNLGTDLQIEALSLLRADRAVTVPLDFWGIVSWLGTALDVNSGVIATGNARILAEAATALERFRAAWSRVDRGRASIRTAAQAGPVNLWLMRTRKDLLPWLIGRNGGGVRTSSIANQVQALANARAAAERGDGAVALQAVERLAGAASRVTREAYTDQRLYAYTSGDWSAQYGQRSRPLPMAIFDIYQRLKNGADPKGEVAALAGLEGEARANLTDALFIVAGKLNQASQALAETPVH